MQHIPDEEVLDLSLRASVKAGVVGLVTRSLVRLGEDVLLAVLVYGGVLDTNPDVVNFFTKTKKVENLHRPSLQAIGAADRKRMRRPVEDADSDSLAEKAGSGGKTDRTS